MGQPPLTRHRSLPFTLPRSGSCGRLRPGEDPLTAVPARGADREWLFPRIADWVPAAMGCPASIMSGSSPWPPGRAPSRSAGRSASGTWLARFTSQGFNVPLNLLTTVAELFIGFPVAAASTRGVRTLQTTLARLSQQDGQMAGVQSRLGDSLAQHTTLTAELKDALNQNIALTEPAEDLSRQVYTLVQVWPPAMLGQIRNHRQ
jgi:hypothetical protein